MAQLSHRDQLLEGAISCLKTKGYARTTARDIATAAEANLASIGYHFGSKEELLNEALIRIFEERNQWVGDITMAAEDASPIDRLTSTFAAVLKLFETNRPLLVAFVEAMAQAEHSDVLRERMANHYRDARRDVGAMVEAGLGAIDELPPGTATTFASFLIATMDGLVVQWLLDAESTPSGVELVAALRDVMTHALALEGSSPRTGLPIVHLGAEVTTEDVRALEDDE